MSSITFVYPSYPVQYHDRLDATYRRTWWYDYAKVLCVKPNEDKEYVNIDFVVTIPDVTQDQIDRLRHLVAYDRKNKFGEVKDWLRRYDNVGVQLMAWVPKHTVSTTDLERISQEGVYIDTSDNDVYMLTYKKADVEGILGWGRSTIPELKREAQSALANVYHQSWFGEQFIDYLARETHAYRCEYALGLLWEVLQPDDQRKLFDLVASTFVRFMIPKTLHDVTINALGDISMNQLLDFFYEPQYDKQAIESARTKVNAGVKDFILNLCKEQERTGTK